MNASLLFGASVVVVALVVAPRATAGDIEGRLQDFGTRSAPVTLEELEMSQPFTERIVIPILQAIAKGTNRLTPKQATEKATKWAVAGIGILMCCH